MNLVEVKKEEIYCDSSMVAKKFGMKHNKITRTIERVLPNIDDFRGTTGTPKIQKVDRTYRGVGYEAYLLDKKAFVVIMMRFETKKARQWQAKFIDAFDAMERLLLQEATNRQNDKWITDRDHSKQIRLETTDVIKDFVEYATGQGSKSAKFYYKHVTRATYKALGLLTQKQPKLRDTLDIYELSQLSTAEQLVQRSFRRHMQDSIPYKVIYKYVIRDLGTFSDSLLLEYKGK